MRPLERLLDAALWAASLAAVHLTFDVLVQHQYAVAISWPVIARGAARAWVVFLFLFYFLHQRDDDDDDNNNNKNRVKARASSHHPRPRRRPRRRLLLQSVFFLMSLLSGCYLIHISTSYGYLAVMKRSPPLACLWLWAVIELDLTPALVSLLLALAFFRFGGYSIQS